MSRLAGIGRGIAGLIVWACGVAGCGAPEHGAGMVVTEPVVLGRTHAPAPAGRPLVVAAVNTAPTTGASPLAGASVDARALVITATGNDSSFGAIQNTLQYLGTPFDVLNAKTGPALTDATLFSGTHGKYNAIFLDVGDLSGEFDDAEWATLTAYEVEFGVRRVALYSAPSASYGLTGGGDGVDPEASPIAAACTAAGKALFVGTNCANPVQINDGYAYPSVPADASTTPLLVDAAGRVYAATRTYPDGREALILTFSQASYYVSYLEIAYGLVTWATRGVFVGERHVYAMPQIDDLFLASAIYTGGTYRITAADMQAFADWETATRANPVTAGFRATWAANGFGSSSMPGDPLTAKAVALGPAFEWVNHSWDHPVLDGLSYASVLDEFTQNDQYLRGLGLMPYATVNAVTPNISGLGSLAAMQALRDAGIQQIVSDSSYADQKNPSPNAGLWNALVPSVLEIPRAATDLYFNVSQPSEWIPEYEALRAVPTLDYPTLNGIISDDLVTDMLNGSNDPWMFHQANVRNYDGAGHSLLSDVLDTAFRKYEAVMTLPVVSPTMDDLAGRVKNRMAFNASGVVATISGGSLTVTVAHAATVPVTGLCVQGAESYAGQTISYLALADGQSATYPLGGCPPVSTPGGGGSGSSETPADAGGLDAGGPDAGRTAGVTVASGSAVSSSVKATSTPAAPAGCACGLAGAGAQGPGALSLVLLGILVIVRRRRSEGGGPMGAPGASPYTTPLAGRPGRGAGGVVELSRGSNGPSSAVTDGGGRLADGGGATAARLFVFAGALACLSCGGGATTPVRTAAQPPTPPSGVGGGAAGASGSGRASGSGGLGGAADRLACADLFDQRTLATYDFDITGDQMSGLEGEFHNLTALDAGLDFATYHPITFRLNGETVTDAQIKLHGQSSWEQTVQLDGDRAKMQFDVSFNQVDPNGSFHGVSKLVFDMPRDDWTFLHDRLSQAWLRQVGILAPCSASARLDINGAYYGLYTLEQGVGAGTVSAFFPANPYGDLWKGDENQLETNKSTGGNTARLKQFNDASDLTSLGAIMDIPGSIASWAAEAVINDSDGYYNGDHNFWLYDQGAAGFVFLPQDTDSTWDWLATFDLPGAKDHPVYWWFSRAQPAPVMGDKWLVVLGDATWRRRYADAIETLLGKFDVGQIQGWIDTWSQQINAAATSDPHAAATPADIQTATQTARRTVSDRATYLQSFVDCEHGTGGAATDADGDGYLWCDECDDGDPRVHPGAQEICGNGIDDDCNGLVDDGCN